MNSSRADARGLAAPQAMATSLMAAFGTSIRHMHFDLSLSTQARSHTRVGSPVVLENLEPTREHDVCTFTLTTSKPPSDSAWLAGIVHVVTHP